MNVAAETKEKAFLLAVAFAKVFLGRRRQNASFFFDFFASNPILCLNFLRLKRNSSMIFLNEVAEVQFCYTSLCPSFLLLKFCRRCTCVMHSHAFSISCWLWPGSSSLETFFRYANFGWRLGVDLSPVLLTTKTCVLPHAV